jgi:hypothetical protein
MFRVYVALAIFTALILGGSALMKLRRAAQVVAIIHDLIGVPLRYFAALAACELAGAAGLLAGIVWPPLGMAAAVGLILYFTAAMISHLRVGDVKGLGPAAFLWGASAACLALRILSARQPS